MRCDAFVGLRVGVDRFTEAFEFRGVKATLQFGDGREPSTPSALRLGSTAIAPSHRTAIATNPTGPHPAARS